MTAHVSADSKFQNRSISFGNVNAGPNSKFSGQQIDERLKVHAISIATGSPTIKEIVAYWMEKFQIDITEQSEKEWRKNNKDRIEKKKHQLIESGDLNIPVVSEQVLSDSMLTLVLSNSRTHNHLQKQIDNVLKKINIEEVGDPEIDKKNKEYLKIFDCLQTAHSNVNKSITDGMRHLFVFAGKIKVKDSQIKKLVDDQFSEKFSKAQELEIDNEAEIDDETREKILNGDVED